MHLTGHAVVRLTHSPVFSSNREPCQTLDWGSSSHASALRLKTPIAQPWRPSVSRLVTFQSPPQLLRMSDYISPTTLLSIPTNRPSSSSQDFLLPSSSPSSSPSLPSLSSSILMANITKSAPGEQSFHNGDPGATASNLITVQPQRREDLQPSYAKTLQGESDDDPSHSWYGTMCKFIDENHPCRC